MNDKFDELAKDLARSITRRGAVKQFGLGLAGVALAALGLGDKALADPQPCATDADCPGGKVCRSGACVPSVRYHCHCGSPNYGCDPSSPTFYDCVFYCGSSTDKHACNGGV